MDVLEWNIHLYDGWFRGTHILGNLHIYIYIIIIVIIIIIIIIVIIIIYIYKLYYIILYIYIIIIYIHTFRVWDVIFRSIEKNKVQWDGVQMGRGQTYCKCFGFPIQVLLVILII